jgi:hypothetical protein
MRHVITHCQSIVDAKPDGHVSIVGDRLVLSVAERRRPGLVTPPQVHPHVFRLPHFSGPKLWHASSFGGWRYEKH